MMLDRVSTGRPISGIVGAKLSSNPIHTNGNVMLSGRSCVSKSIALSAISIHVNTSAAPVYHVNPKFQATSAERIAVLSSMIGYRAEIFALQLAHLPRRNR